MRKALRCGFLALLLTRFPALPAVAGTDAPVPTSWHRPFTAAAASDFLARQAAIVRREDRDLEGLSALESWAQAEIERLDAAGGEDSLDAASTIEISLEAKELRLRLETDSDRFLADRALRIRESLLGQEAIELLPALHVLCRVATGQKRELEVLGYARRALSIAEAQMPPDDLRLVQPLEDLNDFHQVFGRFAEALALQERVLDIQSRYLGPDHPGTVWSAYQIARLSYYSGDFSRARCSLEEVWPLLEKSFGRESREVAAATQFRGLIAMQEGDYPEASAAFETALAMRERLFPPGHTEIGQTLHNLGSLALEMGEPELAQERFRRTVEIWRQRVPPDLEYTLPLAALGESLAASGDREGARRAYEEAIRDLEAAGGQRPYPYYFLALKGLGALFIEEGDGEKARPLLVRALDLARERFAPAHPEVAEIEDLLSRVDQIESLWESARAHSQRALGIKEQVLGQRHPSVAETLSDLSRIATAEREFRDAYFLARRAWEIRNDSLREVARSLPERQALNFGERARGGLLEVTSAATDLADGFPVADVWDAWIRSRGAILDELAQRNRSLAASRDARVSELGESLDAARRRLARLILVGPGEEDPAGYSGRVLAARDAKESAERELAAVVGNAGSAHSFRREGFSDILPALPAGSALVAYVRYGDPQRYGAFVVRADEGKPAWVDLGTAREIDDLVSRWRLKAGTLPPARVRAAKLEENDLRKTGSSLRRAVLEPLRQAIEGAGLVFVVPEGELHQLSFAALPDPGGGYLLESGLEFHYLSAERDLLTLGTQGATVGGLIAAGGPAYDEAPAYRTAPRGAQAVVKAAKLRGISSRCSDLRSLRFGPLPGSAVEAQEVARSWSDAASKRGDRSDVRVLLGRDASETEFKASAPGHGVIHLATHGFFLGDQCALESPPSPPLKNTTASSATIAPSAENPLLRAGLAFAGANVRVEGKGTEDRDDGILTAEEIASLDLSRTQWAVLSACDTGAGEIRGVEGLVGLRRAFVVAGARTVITSLWAASDSASAEWTRALYGKRLAGRSTAAAVREASMEILRARRAAGRDTHPFFWGGFVAVGDWR